jgi:5,5'-dehydrodivanillate O-demethylase
MASKYADFISVGPQSLAGRFLRRFWQPVFLSSRLAHGSAVPLRVLDEDFTLYRGESGVVGLIAPRCAHRGLPLSLGRVEGDRLSCLYHGWTYDTRGQCVAQPAEKRSFAESVRLSNHPVREYHGLIFAYFGPGRTPDFPVFSALEQEGIVEARESRRAYPFFNQLENSVDEVHFNFVHRKSAFTDAGLNDEIPEITAEETDYGILRSGRRGNAERISHILMPNCMFASVYGHDKGWTEHFAWRVPIDHKSHTSFQLVMIHKTGTEAEEYRALQARQKAELERLEPAARVVERILRGEMHLDEIADRPDLLTIQDAVAMQGQGADLDREKDWLGTSDLQVRLLRKIWTREMRALGAGEGKKWRIPADLAVTTGVEAGEVRISPLSR